MNPLLTVIIAFMIGFVEWWLALRRVLALTNGERILTFILVLAEGVLGWLILWNFISVPTYPVDQSQINCLMSLWGVIKAYRWKIAIALAASIGGAIGSLLVTKKR